ncbi:casein kinase II, regulatory subunit [Powellomyces hirtus]|nr:casein kinase II, regulatory subunit [Powellomyces hirtus]
MSAEDSYEETDSETGSSVISWVSWYCSLPGHEYFLEVPEDFIEDDFNLTGLSYGIPYYNEALDLILDIDQEEPANPACMSEIESSAEILYGSIHARYIITKPGLHGMLQKYLEGVFGTCPRVYCGALGALSLLPMGPSDVPGEDTIKMVCGRCGDLYFPKEAKYQSIDGAFFGTTFPHFLWLTYPDSLPPNVSRSENPLQFLRPKMELGRVDDDENDDEDYYGQDKRSSSSDEQESRGTGDDSDDPLTYRIYQPRIFGFRVNERSVVGPRMAWLRWKDVVDEDGPRT